MKMRRHRQPLEIMAEMNITNLLDTAFILLITFMLVAPQLTHWVKISLPEVKKAPSLSVDMNNTVLISILKIEEGEPEERILLDKQRVTPEEVYERVREKHEMNPDIAVVIDVDKHSYSGMLLKILGAVARAGVDNVGFRTVPEKPE